MYYIVTIRKSQVKDYVSYDNLRAKVLGLKLMLPRMYIIEIGYEAHGLYRQLHVHLLIDSLKIDYKMINRKMKGDGYIYHFKKCNIQFAEDVERICNYITKYDTDPCMRHMILIENYLNYFYGF